MTSSSTASLGRCHQFLDLLVGIVIGAVGAVIYPDGSYKIISPAEITTFSDHIVASYPSLAEPADIELGLWQAFSSGWMGMVLEQMQKITAQVAIAALDLRLLVRGGLSRGKLYHFGQVVVGEAMIDAYRLESTVALNPRVVVSPRITDDDLRLFQDDDHGRCLDYVGEMLLIAEDRYGDARAWARETLHEVMSVVGTLTGGGRPKEAAKWMYFRDRLRHAMETWS